MNKGFHGKILEVNLTSKKFTETAIPEEEYRLYLGGSGLAARLFEQRNYDRYDSFSPEAPLLLMTGVLTGHAVPTACKAAFCGLSPATGIWSESAVGGYWPAAFKTSGYDGLVITGKAESPVYLHFGANGPELKDAANLWGKDVYATQDAIREENGDKTRVAAIGPAGENQALIAAIIIDGHDSRAAGRCGMGAMMGFKNLKALSVQPGDKTPKIFDKAGMAEARKAVTQKIREKAKGLTDYGTAGGVPVVEKLGDLPIRNWTKGSWPEGAAQTSGLAMVEKDLFVKHYACFSCPIRCGKDMKVTVGPHKGTASHGPEYETAAGFGALCLNDDPRYIIAANDLCNRLGLDTISTAAMVAFAMELFENNMIPADLLGGLDLSWGNGESILTLVQQIASREGLGAKLALGSKRAAAFFGPLAYEFIAESKGLELAFHDPRAFTSMAVVYATGNRGACHLEGLTYFNENRAYPGSLIGLPDEYDPHASEGKALLAKTMQDYMNIFNALGLCKFLIRGHVVPEDIALWVAKVTGWDMDKEELILAGERLFNLKRVINVKLGITRKDDTLSPRLLAHDRGEGAADGSLPHLGKMLYEYYNLRGWSQEGIPLAVTLERLGLAKGQ